MAPLSAGRTPWILPTRRCRRKDSPRASTLPAPEPAQYQPDDDAANRRTLEEPDRDAAHPRVAEQLQHGPGIQCRPPSLRAAVFRQPSPAHGIVSQEVEERPLFLGEVALLGDDHLFYALAIIGDHRPLYVVLDSAWAYLGRAG